MDAAVRQLRREGYSVQDEDVEKLSPLQYGHINMQGRYSFTVPESVSKGELGGWFRYSSNPICH
ncbi:Tn3 transposase [Photorhabdus aegyptia]|uniref:Tn3 transposase n=1 Tax=Photorhabdus aegyptia TaxID=2805098 RepID=A0A022PFH3_9GAMM|nr:Tn3 transposase [Photorhabdus aegyptia]